MTPRYIVHVTGDSPHRIDHWTKPYKTLAAASAQATRLTPRNRDGSQRGDWVSRIYRLGEEDYRGPNPGPVLRLIETRRP